MEAEAGGVSWRRRRGRVDGERTKELLMNKGAGMEDED